MKKLIVHHWIYFLFIPLVVWECAEPPSATTETSLASPNVVIILADDLGYGDLSYFGQKDYETAHIDSLAGNSVVCTDFYVPTPYCAPSRATLLTGRFPLRHGLVQNPTPDAGINDIGIDAGERTLGELFQENGYRTLCVGKWHLGHKEEFFPVNHGFDHYYGILYSNDMRPVQIVEDRDTVQYPVDQSLLTRDYTDRALDFISTENKKPFFLYLSHAMPHKPLAASEEFYSPDTPEDLYADVMRELDWSVGRVMQRLRSLEILDNTIVIFMSDNGPWYGGSTGGLKGMKATTWEGGIRVPFMIHYPGALGTHREINVPCWSPDLYPTLRSLTGVSDAEAPELDGRDITALLKGEKTERRPIFSMHNSTIMSVRMGDWKLFVNRPPTYKSVDLATWSDPRGPDGETIIAPPEQATPADYPGLKPLVSEQNIQLYNLRNDPTETHDMATERPEIVDELMREYNLYQQNSH